MIVEYRLIDWIPNCIEILGQLEDKKQIAIKQGALLNFNFSVWSNYVQCGFVLTCNGSLLQDTRHAFKDVP
jgi:hypothetical protein